MGRKELPFYNFTKFVEEREENLLEQECHRGGRASWGDLMDWSLCGTPPRSPHLHTLTIGAGTTFFLNS